MNITIKRFGPIAEFDYDLDKDLIVTYGNNNIGKSYAMQIVYLLLKSISDSVLYNDVFYDRIFKYYSKHLISPSSLGMMRSIVEEFATKNLKSLEITQKINDSFLIHFKETCYASFYNSCQNTFGNFKEIEKRKPKIVADIGPFVFTFNIGETEPIQGEFYSYPTFIKKTKSDFHKSRNANGQLHIYYHDNVNTSLETIIDAISEQFRIISKEIINHIGDVFFLPASRSGIYSGMSAFSSIIAELSKSKAALTRKIELPGISEPISDYFLLLSNMKARENKSLLSVYSSIEKDILKGTVQINNKKNTLVYVPDNIDHEFEMTEVSSMVSEISPIVAFLKYILFRDSSQRNNKAKPIVFIEEPEAHLHPNNQIKLITLFSKLYSLGIKVIISSHSNYIFNKLNNLLLEKTITPEVYSPIILQAGEDGSISSFMTIDELGVDDTNFLDVASQLFDERERLIELWEE